MRRKVAATASPGIQYASVNYLAYRCSVTASSANSCFRDAARSAREARALFEQTPARAANWNSSLQAIESVAADAKRASRRATAAWRRVTNVAIDDRRGPVILVRAGRKLLFDESESSRAIISKIHSRIQDDAEVARAAAESATGRLDQLREMVRSIAT
jgi:hypothetical protein